MSLTREQVEHVSLLARLRLTEEQLQTMTRQLGQIVEYMALLDELDTASVEPMTHAIPSQNVLAADEPRPSFSRDQMLANAPRRDDECYRVPAVLGE